MNLAEWVVVLDLDDTLYPEYSYQSSGIAAVEELLSTCFNRPLQGTLTAAQASGVSDLWGWACDQLGLPPEVKTSLLWAYRLHRPQLTLASDVRICLESLQTAGATLAVLSDGRALSQRLKLASLGLAALPVFISEEHGSVKPDPARFETIARHWPGRRYVYVADNPVKDFLAPNRLGWLSVGLKATYATVHGQPSDGPAELQPQHWIDTLPALLPLLVHAPTPVPQPTSVDAF